MEQVRKDTVEIAARTVEEAVELALKELGASRDEVTVEVLSEGRSGFLGIGAQPARVRVSRIPVENEALRVARDFVDFLLASLRVDCRAMPAPSFPEAPETPVLQVEGADAGLLIGRRGETLRVLQFLVNLVVGHLTEGRGRVLLDIGHYRERRYRALRDLARRVADRVARTGRPYTLRPMPPDERRVVHLTLVNHPRVTTQSVGQGAERRVVVMPRQARPPRRPRAPRPSA